MIIDKGIQNIKRGSGKATGKPTLNFNTRIRSILFYIIAFLHWRPRSKEISDPMKGEPTKMNKKLHPKPALNLRQVAERLSLNPATVREEVRRGRLHAFLIDRAIRVTEEDLALYLTARKKAASIKLCEPRGKSQNHNRDLPGQEFFDQVRK